MHKSQVIYSLKKKIKSLLDGQVFRWDKPFFSGRDIFRGRRLDTENSIGREGGSEFGGIHVFRENVGPGEFPGHPRVRARLLVLGVHS